MLTNFLYEKVGASEIISKINQTAAKISIEASKINFNGMITANRTFQIDISGNMKATGGKIGGWTITGSTLECKTNDTLVEISSDVTSGSWEINPGAWGNTHAHFDNFNSHPELTKNFIRIANTPDLVPQGGDIVVWKKETGFLYGHVAIATGEGNLK